MRLDPRKIEIKGLGSRGSGGDSFPGRLYADLRDRRLLIPVVALAVATVAVPVLLSSDPAPAPAPGPATSLDDAVAVSPAVLVKSPGVRNYRERLRALKRSNPFDQQFSRVADDATVEVATGETDPSVSVAGEGAAGSAASGAAAATSPATSAEISVSSDSSAPENGASDEGTDSSGGAAVSTGSADASAEEQPSLYTGTASITFGPLGDAKRYRDVERFEMLPNVKRPVIAFLGLSVDAERGYFLASGDVTETRGDGRCIPQRPARCQILELAVGDQHQLIIGVESVTYRLRLTDTGIEPVRDPRSD